MTDDEIRRRVAIATAERDILNCYAQIDVHRKTVSDAMVKIELAYSTIDELRQVIADNTPYEPASRSNEG